MKNKEYFKDQIYDILCSCKSVAVNSKTGEPFMCNGSCANCALFRRDDTCKTRAFMNWLDEEHKEHVLTYEEMQYLENIVRPFKDRVKSITKRLYSNDDAYIQLNAKSIYERNYELMNLPLFVRNKMYKGMVYEKEYTLKDLGLFENE